MDQRFALLLGRNLGFQSKMRVRFRIERMKGLKKLTWETFKEMYEIYFVLPLLNFLLTEWQLTQRYSLPLPLLPALTQIRNPLA